MLGSWYCVPIRPRTDRFANACQPATEKIPLAGVMPCLKQSSSVGLMNTGIFA